MNIFLCLLSGILLALCFPKFNLSFLAWFALVPLLISIHKAKDPKESALYSFISALFFFSITLFWINTLTEYAGVFATLGWVGLVLLQGAFFMLFGYFIRFFKWQGSLLAALLYVFIEWLRELGPFGISAGGLGYSQVSFLPLIQIASFTSVLGVSFLIVCSNICITNLLTQDKRSGINLTIFVLLIIISLSYGSYVLNQKTVPGKNPLKIAIIQANIPQEWKLDMRYNQKVFGIHEELTRSILQERPDLIIWPETMVLSYVMRNLPFRNKIEILAKRSEAYFVFGTPYKDKNKIYNSIVALSKNGKVLGRYDKKLLVPFGEYLPLRSIFYPILRSTGFFHEDFNSNPHPHLLDLEKLKIGAVICFESTFIRPLKEFSKRGADLLLVVTNDAWFKDSAALEQHINCGVFRAVENRKYFIQVANTGISAVIDPYGRFLIKTEIGKREALIFKIPLP